MLMSHARFRASVVSEEDALTFLATGSAPPGTSPRAFLDACMRLDAFKAKAWPHFACFVDASNVARRRRVAAHEVTAPKARLADLDAVVDALRKSGYVPLVVSDANLFRLIDEPFEFKRKYMGRPHTVAEGREADRVVLHALRRLPEAAVVTNDRFAKPDEQRDFGDVLREVEGRFYRHRWDGDTPRFTTPRGEPMPHARDRFVRSRLIKSGESGNMSAPDDERGARSG